MDDKQLQAKFVGILDRIGFSTRYYEFYERRKGLKCGPLGSEVYESVLRATGLEFKYDKRERFYGNREFIGACELILNASFRDGVLEFVLAIRTSSGTVGGPFHLLAFQVALLKNPDFVHTPAYPRLPFGSRDELSEVVSFGFELYREARDLILKEDWGCL